MNTTRAASVLILALWTLMVLTFLALAVGGYVSANVRLATSLREGATAYALDRAGVELTMAEVMQNPSNYAGVVLADLQDHADLFRDNASLPGGTFSVFFTLDDTNTSAIVTNFGVLREAAKIDIDRASAADYSRLGQVLKMAGASPDLAVGILSNYPSGKTIAPDDLTRYGPYEALPELLAVDGVDGTLYEALEPLITLREFERKYKAGVEAWERRLSYGGMAEGRAMVQAEGREPKVLAVRRIAFVFDGLTTNLLFWREH